jgi:hypothetical protein
MLEGMKENYLESSITSHLKVLGLGTDDVSMCREHFIVTEDSQIAVSRVEEIASREASEQAGITERC